MKNITKKTRKDKLSNLDSTKSSAHLAPIDYTKELLKSEGKDSRLYKYYKFYEKQDFHDRYIKIAVFLLALSYLLSIASSYLSFPFLTAYLAKDIPNENLLFYAVLAVVGLIEIVKHTSLATAFKTHYTYKEKPFISGLFLVLAVSASIYMCVNGIVTTSEKDYDNNLPVASSITTQYDNQIKKLITKNKGIFDKHNYRGKINESSDAGKAHGANEKLLSVLEGKQMTERETKFNKAISKYDKKHTKTSSLRKYIGYIIEFSIVFCNGFFLFFMFNSSLEHISRLLEKFLTFDTDGGGHEPNLVFNSGIETQKPIKVKKRRSKRSKSVGGGNAGENVVNRSKRVATSDTTQNVTAEITNYPTTGKTLTYQQVTNRLGTYQGYLDRGERTKANNKARVNYYSYLLQKMHDSNANKIQEIKFTKADWLE